MPPILSNKDTSAPSVFRPEALLREARRQKGLPAVDVPSVCILDPDGDIVRRLRQDGRTRPFEGWPCYHTGLDAFELGGRTVGIVGCAVGAPFAVLVAEELFAGGCKLLLSLTSSGQITPSGPTPYFVIIDRALRDEGTSYHYAAPGEFDGPDLAACRESKIGVAPKQQGHLCRRDGERIHHSAKPPRRSQQPTPKAFLRSRWKRRRFTRSLALPARRCCALRMSQIRWDRLVTTLEKARRTELQTLWLFSKLYFRSLASHDTRGSERLAVAEPSLGARSEVTGFDHGGVGTLAC